MQQWKVSTALCLVLGAASCTTSPASPAGVVTVTTPTAASPANGALVPNGSQPITITVNNGFVTSSPEDASYTFQIATDPAFATVVATKNVPQGAGQTSVKRDALAPGKDYYWHARTQSGDTVGVFTSALKFTIGSAVVLQAPIPVPPASGDAVVPHATFTVTNAARTGPAGQVTYKFEVAASQAFSPILASGAQPEGNGQTSFTVAQDLPEQTNLFWRAQAIDAANASTGPFSTATAFKTTVTFDLHKVDYQRFVNPADWPETDKIIEVDQDGGDGYICINHTKRGVWPAAPFLGDPGTETEGTQWSFRQHQRQVVRRGGRVGAAEPDLQVGADVCRDRAQIGWWGGPMSTWVPKVGELVGYMMSTPARSYPAGRTLDERSDVVMVPWKVFGSTTPSTTGDKRVR